MLKRRVSDVNYSNPLSSAGSRIGLVDSFLKNLDDKKTHFAFGFLSS